MHEIIIRAVANGFIVRVGCREVVFESAARLLSELGRYLENPSKVEQEYLGSEKYPQSVVPPPQPTTVGELGHVGRTQPSGAIPTSAQNRQTDRP